MGDNSKIEWTDATWNPVRGCALVSAGCTNCYAMRQAHRSSGKGRAYDGLTKMTSHGPVWTGAVRTLPEMLDQPIRWTRGRRIFVNSMSDLFHEDVSFFFIAQVFAVMSITTRHTYQILTKRPERMRAFFRWLSDENDKLEFLTEGHPHYFPEVISDCVDEVWPRWIPHREGKHGGYDNCGPAWPLENVWLGVSIENQDMAAERLLPLLQTPAAVRWISAEPLLGPLELEHVLWRHGHTRINWLVAGGESGPNARPSHPEWFRSLRDQCKHHSVPFFFKQWGAWAPWEPRHPASLVKHINVQGEIGDYPRLTEPIVHVGKKAAGNLLDGRTHLEFPR